jgi:segregation and condensation protein A
LITEQYLEYLAVLEQIDVNAVGEFLEMASTLIEIKSRMVLPRCDEVEDEVEDPRSELVRRLLEYKQYRDAASILEERRRQWQDRFPRLAGDLPPRHVDPAEQPLHDVQLWDLVSAVGRIMQQKAAASDPATIRYDDTPIHVYMRRIYLRLTGGQQLGFSQLFDGPAHRSTVVGMFLAVLELIRHHWARATQAETFGEIWLSRGQRPLPEDIEFVEEYDVGRTEREAPAPEGAYTPTHGLATTPTEPAVQAVRLHPYDPQSSGQNAAARQSDD